jgi:NAD(P)-dependent dehydrogenase (short-subunit alcohol dehydrogenase family)
MASARGRSAAETSTNCGANRPSAAARIGLANHEAIAAAKGGVISLTLSAAASYAAKQVRVNCVAPGFMHTEMTESLGSDSIDIITRRSPLGRLPEASSVAAAISFLLGPAGADISGAVFTIDAGNSA